MNGEEEEEEEEKKDEVVLVFLIALSITIPHIVIASVWIELYV